MGSLPEMYRGQPNQHRLWCCPAWIEERAHVAAWVMSIWGRFIREELEREGRRHARCANGQRGVLPPSPSLVFVTNISFRCCFIAGNCADMALSVDDIDEALIAQARVLVATGTHLVNPRTRPAVLKALQLSRKHGAKIALDIDYPSQFVGRRRPRRRGKALHRKRRASASQLQEQAFGYFDLIVGTEEEFHIAGGIGHDRKPSRLCDIRRKGH